MQIVTTHKNTDFDALASVIAVTILYPGSCPILPKNLNPNVKAFLSIHKDLLQISAVDDIDLELAEALAEAGYCYGFMGIDAGDRAARARIKKNYDDEDVVLMTLFSAGGETNDDLTEDSSYRGVTPHALTVTLDNGEIELTPWPIDYEKYNDPELNRFFADEPEIEHRE